MDETVTCDIDPMDTTPTVHAMTALSLRWCSTMPLAVRSFDGRLQELTCWISGQYFKVYWPYKQGPNSIYGEAYFCMELKIDKEGGWRYTDQHVCIKRSSKERVRKAQEKGALREDPYKELQIMNILQARGVLHPNLNILVDAMEDKESLYSVAHYCNGGEVYELLAGSMQSGNGPFSEDKAGQIFCGMLRGMAYMHLQSASAVAVQQSTVHPCVTASALSGGPLLGFCLGAACVSG